MPDYGQRQPPYMSSDLPRGILGQAPYGWAGTPLAGVENTPSDGKYFPAENFAYERLDWAKFKAQLQNAGGPAAGATIAGAATAGYWSNPPFLGAGQMTGPNGAPTWMRDSSGGTSRIMRGYLRRQKVDPTKPESFVRLYFMYNPDTVVREYIGWDSSMTIDAANTFGIDSENAPAGTTDLTTIRFTLFFDRQIECATILDHPGVMVDLQAFDFLTGNMSTKQDAAGGEVTVLPPGMHIPDNTDTSENHAGQLQPSVNYQNGFCAAIFSPSLMVEGVINSASVSFTKFSSKMTPMTMALTLTMYIWYAGKSNNQTTSADMGVGALPSDSKSYAPNVPGFVPPSTQADRNAATKAGAAAAVAWASAYLMDNGTDNHYDPNKRQQGPPCQAPTGNTFTDCSSFVWRSFAAIGWTGVENGDDLRLTGSCTTTIPSSGEFLRLIHANSQETTADRRWLVIKRISPQDRADVTVDTYGGHGLVSDIVVGYFRALRPGDVLVRKVGTAGHAQGHVAMIWLTPVNLTPIQWTQKDTISLIMSSGTPKPSKDDQQYLLGGNISTTSMEYIWTNYDLMARPEPWGPTTDYSRTIDAGGTLT